MLQNFLGTIIKLRHAAVQKNNQGASFKENWKPPGKILLLAGKFFVWQIACYVNWTVN